MKKVPLFLLTLAAALLLAACGSTAAQPEDTGSDDPNLGKYLCTSMEVDGMSLNPDGQWIQLSSQGRATVFLSEEPDEGLWSLSGTTFTMTMGGETVATGTLEGGRLTVNLMGTACVFCKEGTFEPAQQSDSVSSDQAAGDGSVQAEAAPDTARFSCSGLYSIAYPTALLHPAEDGLTDLVSDDGLQVWVTRLESKDQVTSWQEVAETKSAGQDCQNFESFQLTAAGYDAKAILYQGEDGWHSAVLVDFGKNLGRDGKDFYAACLYFAGSSREAVWSQDVQDMVSSLHLET
ncbi:MAG: hypothetical protein ACI3VS_07815 [Evtepia sp.]